MNAFNWRDAPSEIGVTDDLIRGHHRDEARRLAAKARGLILGRSAGYVAKLEQARGLI
jgi:hypothetical protein